MLLNPRQNPPHFIYLTLALCCLLCVPHKSAAVQQLPDDWPPIPANVDTLGFALILGGGGARGIAHIGVIEILEELGMRPSLIVGTSMGSVVGALYASGMSSAELREIALNEDLGNLVVDIETPPAQLQGGWWGPAPYLLSLQITHWPPLPDTGFSRGQGFESLVGEHTGDALFLADNDFDKLPIPFRCLSTDLLDDTLVIHDSGLLPRAVKASSTIPMIFYPVEMDGRQLVDGGFLDNLPVQVARRLGFDRAVLVDVSNVHLADKQEPTNLYEMWIRLAELQTIFPNDYTVGEHDVLLKMPLSSYRSMHMEAGADIMAIGRETALQNRSELLALRAACGPIANQPPPPTSNLGPLTLKSIEVLGLERMRPALVMDRLHMHPGDQMTPAKAWQNAEWLTKEGSFQTIGFEFIPVDGDTADVIIHVQEETKARLELGANVITDDGAAVLGRLRFDNFMGQGGSNLLSYRYSGRLARFDAVLEQPFSSAGWLSLLGKFQWKREQPGLYDHGIEVDQYVFRQEKFSLDLAVRSFRHGWSLYLGGDFGETNSYLESHLIPDDGIERVRTVHVSLESHGRDLPVTHQSRGARIRYIHSLDTKDDEPDWWRADMGMVVPLDWLEAWNPVLAAGAVASSDNIPVVHQGRAGGPRGWVGLRRQEIISPNIAWTRVALQRKLSTSVYLEVAGAVGWYGQKDLSASQPLWGGGVEIGSSSLVGPLRLGYALAEDRPGYVYLQIGHEF